MFDQYDQEMMKANSTEMIREVQMILVCKGKGVGGKLDWEWLDEHSWSKGEL